MKKFKQVLLLLSFLVLATYCAPNKTKVLVYNKANGFVHESIGPGTEAIKYLEKTYPFIVEVSDDSLIFRESSLSNFDVILFMNTSGNILDEEGEAAFENFIKNGGGFVGVHAASDTEYEWAWYGKCVGNYFHSHPEIQTAELTVHIPDAPSTKHLPEKYEWNDEWYNWKNEFNSNLQVLITVDENTYEGGIHKDFHPVSWRQEYEGGRCWYTAMGHASETYAKEKFIKHIAGGIEWVSEK